MCACVSCSVVALQVLVWRACCLSCASVQGLAVVCFVECVSQCGVCFSRGGACRRFRRVGSLAQIFPLLQMGGAAVRLFAVKLFGLLRIA